MWEGERVVVGLVFGLRGPQRAQSAQVLSNQVVTGSDESRPSNTLSTSPASQAADVTQPASPDSLPVPAVPFPYLPTIPWVDKACLHFNARDLRPAFLAHSMFP